MLYNDLISPFWQLHELGFIYPHGLHRITQLVSGAMEIETQVSLITEPKL